MDGPPNGANRIFPRLTLVSMGTKFGKNMGYNSLTAIIGLRLVKLALGLLQCFPGLY